MFISLKNFFIYFNSLTSLKNIYFNYKCINVKKINHKKIHKNKNYAYFGAKY